jgi:hypothetical protein
VSTEATKPQVFLTKIKTNSIDGRPQTAPAAFNSSRATPLCPPSTPAPSLSFTSSYVTQQLISNNKRPWTHIGAMRTTIDVAGHADKSNLSALGSDNPPPAVYSNKLPTAGVIYDNVMGVAAEMTIDRMTAISRPVSTNSQKITQQKLKPKAAKPANENKTDHGEQMNFLETIVEEDHHHDDDDCSIDEDKLNKQMTASNNNNKKSRNGKQAIQEMKIFQQRRQHKPQKTNNVDKAKLNDATAPLVISITRPNGDRNKSPQLNKRQSMKRESTHIGVINLSLHCDYSAASTARRRMPSELKPIVAGFNKHHYRPKIVT